MQVQQPNEDALVRNATERVSATEPRVERDRVERRVREIVHDLCAHSRVTNFIGVIAERRAREELRRSASGRR
jgi:hypothetical protein